MQMFGYLSVSLSDNRQEGSAQKLLNFNFLVPSSVVPMEFMKYFD